MRKWNRRHFAKIGAAAVLLSPSTALAFHECKDIEIPGGKKGEDCIAGIASHRFRHVSAVQNSMFGSWAAAMQMVFAGNGYYIEQQDIASQTFTKEEITKLGSTTGQGDVQNSFDLMNSLEGKEYIDQAENTFSVRLRYFGADLGTATNNAKIIIKQLDNEIPMVYCSDTHMMALIGVSYVTREDVPYPQLTGGWVGDPFIATKPVSDLELGFRDLGPDEVLPVSLGGRLVFIAQVKILGGNRSRRRKTARDKTRVPNKR